MKAVIAEAIEGVGAFIDLFQGTINIIHKFSTKVTNTIREILNGGKPGGDI